MLNIGLKCTLTAAGTPCSIVLFCSCTVASNSRTKGSIGSQNAFVVRVHCEEMVFPLGKISLDRKTPG